METPPNIEEIRSLLAACLMELSALRAEHKALQILYEELRLENIKLKAENAALKAESAALKAENAELRRRLGMNSKNSHKPPGSDGYKKPKSPALPRTSGKKQGGQQGHEGDTLKMVSAPDRVVVHKPEKCSRCGKKFTDRTKYQELSERRQVWDIPVPSMEVTEHRISGAKCCGMIHKGSFPPEAGAPVQYGNRILTLAGMPNVDFRMPYEKISQLTEDLYGVRMNKSTICRANERLFRNLEPIEKAIKKALLTSKVAHFDETGMRVEGSTHWFHTVSNERFCHLFVHKSRGREALESADSLLPGFGGRAVHDCLSSYFNFTQTSHALCNAHILRELKGLAENGSNWAPVMSEFLMELYTATEKGTSVVNNPDEWNRRYDSICKQADNEEPPPVKSPRGKVKSSKGRNLFNRLSLHRSGVLAFANVPGVPFTNNPAEQDLRCVKIKQKVAMSFRTFTGAKIFARIQAAVKTFRKQGLNIFNSLLSVNLKQYLFFQGT